MNLRKPALAATSAAVLAAGLSFLDARAVRGQPPAQPPPASAQVGSGRVTAAPAADHPANAAADLSPKPPVVPLTAAEEAKQTVRARFVRMTQTASVDNAPVWIIERLRLYQAPPP